MSDDDIRDRWALAIAERDAAEHERDRLRSALLDILVVQSVDSAHLLAHAALDGVTSELDQAVEHAALRDERDRLRQALDDALAALDSKEGA